MSAHLLAKQWTHGQITKEQLTLFSENFYYGGEGEQEGRQAVEGVEQLKQHADEVYNLVQLSQVCMRVLPGQDHKRA